MREKKVFHLFDSHKRVPDLIKLIDILARLSVYTVPSSAPSYTALVPHFLQPQSALPHTAVVIVLDWTRPWTFLEELHTWLAWIERWVQGDGARELEVIREEHRERCMSHLNHHSRHLSPDHCFSGQAHLQHYTEPSAEPLLATSSALQGTILPLGQGTFTHNTAGVPIIVACTKADLIDDNTDLVGAGASGMGGMVKGKGGEWEERTDGIMQILRTICLKCACHFFIRFSFSWRGRRRKPLLHDSAADDTQRPAPIHAPCPICTPSAFPRRRARQHCGTSAQPIPVRPQTEYPRPRPHRRASRLGQLGQDRRVARRLRRKSMGRGMGARSIFRRRRNRLGQHHRRRAKNVRVPRTGPRAQSTFTLLYLTYPLLTPTQPNPLPPLNNPTPEQAFLTKNYDENARRADRDPRGIFRTPTDASAAPAAGLVGPLGASSFSLPTVERALAEMEGRAVSGDAQAPHRRRLYSGARRVRRSMKCCRTSLRAC